MIHGDVYCTKYNDTVLPDENGNCSLCGATLSSKCVQYKVIFEVDEEEARHVAPTGEPLSVEDGVGLLFFFMQIGNIAKLVSYKKLTEVDILTEADIPF